MTGLLEKTERRVDERLKNSLQITLLDHKVDLENISAGGVYFELVTDNIVPFSLGRIVEFEILAKTYTPVSSSGTIRLKGRGKIIRNNKTSNEKYGIALIFDEKLEILVDKRSIVNLRFKKTERRGDKRLEHPLQITLLDHKVNLENISPGGVYFEVVMDDIELFSLGRTVEFEILAKTYTPVSPSGTIRLKGSGKIIRNNKTGNKKYGIALRFSEKLEILFDN
ncbi:MAG TPA: PilZ domain-containing protein [Candidatus Scalindua sp.]|nr:PilZ domain-containing protein [Candidatus Scalindua sp.]